MPICTKWLYSFFVGCNLKCWLSCLQTWKTEQCSQLEWQRTFFFLLPCNLCTTSSQAGSSCLQFGVRSYLHHFYEECSSSMWERDPEDRGFVQSQRSALWWNSAVWKVEEPRSVHLNHHHLIYPILSWYSSHYLLHIQFSDFCSCELN